MMNDSAKIGFNHLLYLGLWTLAADLSTCLPQDSMNSYGMKNRLVQKNSWNFHLAKQEVYRYEYTYIV